MKSGHPRVSRELGEILEEITRAYRAGDFREMMVLARSYPAEVWLGMRPERISMLLERVVAAGGTEAEEAQGLLRMAETPPDVPRGGGTLPSLDESPLAQLHLIVNLRAQGRSIEAVSLIDGLDPGAIPLFGLNRNNGWNLLQTLQCAAAHMHGDQPGDALWYLSSAQLHPVIPTLPFLSRDACVKHALLHAMFGDPEDARRALARSESIARSESWMEPLVDAQATVAAALLDDGDPDHAVDLLESMPLSDIGDMWAYFVCALGRLFIRSGRSAELAARVEVLEHSGFPRYPGEGLEGSVFAYTRAAVAYTQGEHERVSELLDGADERHPVSLLFRAQTMMLTGRFDDARGLAVQVEQRSSSLAQLRVTAQSIVASARLASGQDDEALRTLEQIASTNARPLGSSFLSTEARTLARRRVAGWAERGEDERHAGQRHPRRLTRREGQVLALLSTDASRAEIAQQLYVSVNTVKSTIRSLYGKLGVANRDDAIIRAREVGLLDAGAGTLAERGEPFTPVPGSPG